MQRVFAGRDRGDVTPVTPVTGPSVTPSKRPGYKGYSGYISKAEEGECGRKHVTVSALDPATDRAVAGETGRVVPAEWARHIALLKSNEPRLGMSPLHWSQFVRDARRFLDEWGAEAARLGWSAEDIFGVHPLAPEARYDVMGIVPLIRGNEVVAISEQRATIRTPGGGRMTYYRYRPNTGAVAVWELLQ
jgi:hypothetical protein